MLAFIAALIQLESFEWTKHWTLFRVYAFFYNQLFNCIILRHDFLFFKYLLLIPTRVLDIHLIFLISFIQSLNESIKCVIMLTFKCGCRYVSNFCLNYCMMSMSNGFLFLDATIKLTFKWILCYHFQSSFFLVD